MVRVVAAIAVGVAATTITSHGVAGAAGPPYPLRPIDVPVDDVANVLTVNHPGTYVVAWDESLIDQRVDSTTGATTPIGFGPDDATEFLSWDGSEAYGLSADGRAIRRVRVGAGGIDELPLPLPLGAVAYRIADGDRSGRWLLIDVDDPGGGGLFAYLYDTTTRAFAPSNGFRDGSLNTFADGISDDGNLVTYATYDPATDITTSYRRWNRSTSQTLVVNRPTHFTSASSPGWTVSDNFKWTIGFREVLGSRFLSVSEVGSPVMRGVYADHGYIEMFDVFDDGRVVFSQTIPEGQPGEGTLQLFRWDGDESLMLSVGRDGLPSDQGIDHGVVGPGLDFVTNDDGSVITFASWSTNLGEAQDVEQHLYQVHLPPYGMPNPHAVMQPGERHCFAPYEVEPGDFVGLNVTPVLATQPGFGVVHSSDDPAGETSNVNFAPGTVDPNVAFAKVGADGLVCFTNSDHAQVHVIIDQMVAANDGLFRLPTSNGAVRLADTRVGDGGPIVGPDERRCLITSGAQPGDFVGVNALVLEARTPGFGTIHSSDGGPGQSSTVNFGPGTFDPNFAFARVGGDGRVCFTNSGHGPVHLVLDELIVTASGVELPHTASGTFRAVDTRTGLGGTRVFPGTHVCFSVPGGSPGEFVGANITPVAASSPGFGILYPSDFGPTSVSNVNFNVGTIDPNLAITQLGPDGRACFWSTTYVDVVIDAQVLFDPSLFRLPNARSAERLVDTRIAR